PRRRSNFLRRATRSSSSTDACTNGQEAGPDESCKGETLQRMADVQSCGAEHVSIQHTRSRHELENSKISALYANKLFNTPSQGFRYGRTCIAAASLSPTISSLSVSQRTLRPSRREMFDRWQATAVWCPSSTSAIGLCRVLMQSRKLRTCRSNCCG